MSSGMAWEELAAYLRGDIASGKNVITAAKTPLIGE
jgi:hypothetical protein